MHRVFFLLTLLTLFTGLTATAEVKTWTGGVGTTFVWSDGANWSGGVSPSAGDDIVFDTPGTIEFVAMPSSISYNSLTIRHGIVILSGTASMTLTIGGAEGKDLVIESGAELIQKTNSNIIIAAGAIVDICGSLTTGSAMTFSAGGDGASVDVKGTLTNQGTYDCGSATQVTTVTGLFVNSGIILNASAQRLLFSDGSTFRHFMEGGIVPVATWSLNSTCTITGIIGEIPVIPDATQPFGNFVWDCPTQLEAIDLGGQIKTVNGNLTIASTGENHLLTAYFTPGDLLINGSLVITGGHFGFGSDIATDVNTLTIKGDFNLVSGTFYVASSEGTASMTVEGNLTSRGLFNFSFSNTETPATVNVNGNCTISAGVCNMSQFTGTGTLYVRGNFSHTGGTITETSSGGGVIVFNGTGRQIYTSGGTVNNNISFTVNDGSYLQMATAGTYTGGNGVFTLSDGATLGVTSIRGITADPALFTGNVRCSGGRVFSPKANYIYNGIDPQITGTGMTGAMALKINNAAGVTLSMPVTVASLTIGDETPNSIFSDGGNKLTPTGALNLVSGTLALGSATAATSYPPFTANNFGVGTEVAYVSSLNQVIEPMTYSDLTLLNGTKTIEAGAAVTVNGDLTTNDQLIINSSDLNNNGSLIVKGTSTGRVTYNRKLRTEADGGDKHHISSPVVSNSASNSGKVTAVKGWDELTGTWKTKSMTALSSGTGYNLDQSAASDGLIAFTGSLVNSDVVISASSPYSDIIDVSEDNIEGRTYASGRNSTTYYGGGGWNLIGNPYTSAIESSVFMTENYSEVPADNQFDPSFLALYIYDGTEGSKGVYRIICPSTGWSHEFMQEKIQTGQGFFVRAMNDNSQFTFKKSMQVHSMSDAILKSEDPKTEPWPGLLLKVQYGSGESTTSVVFNNAMTTGLDPGYDVGQLSLNPDVEIYTALVDDNSVNFTRQALPALNYEQNVVSVGVDSKNGGTVTFSATIVPVEGYKFYLEDRNNNIFTDLSLNNYTVTLPANTYGKNRFFLYTSSGNPSAVDDDITDQPIVSIWSYDNEIIIKGNMSGKATCALYDIKGSLIINTAIPDETINRLPVSHLAKGVYIVTVTDGDKVYKQKIVL